MRQCIRDDVMGDRKPLRCGELRLRVVPRLLTGAMDVRMRRKEARAMPPTSPPEHAGTEWGPVLDGELNRLPVNYRLPLLLCDVEGLTRKEAAHQLGWAEGTVSSRLSRGRELLARRLRRHGLGLGIQRHRSAGTGIHRSPDRDAAGGVALDPAPAEHRGHDHRV